jgi:hypothetical protein
MKPKRTKMLSVRASEEEIQRVKDLAAELMEKNQYITEADVLRELIGLEDTGLITPTMRKRLCSNHIPAEKNIPTNAGSGRQKATLYIPSKKGGVK